MATTNIIHDLDYKINLLNNVKQNPDFIIKLKDVVEYLNQLDMPTAEKKIFQNILPRINSQFNKVYSDNYSLFETLDDELLSMIIKENLEVAFHLTEIFQEILMYTCQHVPIIVKEIESILRYVPSCIQLFLDHWKNSSDLYKDTFNAELSKLLEVVKYLYETFLHLLESLVEIENRDTVNVLVDAFCFICKIPTVLYDIDASSAISSWKCFGVAIAKHSTFLENVMNLQIPVNAICEDIYNKLNYLDQDVETFHDEIKIINFLLKMLMKISHIFYEKLDTFALELLTFYIKVSSLSPDHYKAKKFSTEALDLLDTDIFNILDILLQHLIMGQSDFKNQLEKITDCINMEEAKEDSLGLLKFICKCMPVVASIGSDCGPIILQFIKAIFVLATLYDLDRNLYEKLIINVSAAILLQEMEYQVMNVLLSHILQHDIFIAIMAVEIYTLVVSNISPEECVTILTNLLYAISDLSCGFFTSRPEMIHLKTLIKRIFDVLPNTSKDDIIKLFNSDQNIQIWKFIGFNSLPTYQIPKIIKPVVVSTSECIRLSYDICTEDDLLNIAEGLDLLAAVNKLDTNDPKFNEITTFMNTFWEINFNANNILENNLMVYFISKISGMTFCCIQNSTINLNVVLTKLNFLLCKTSYWVSVYKIIYNILIALPFTSIPDSDKEHILKQIANMISICIQNKTNEVLEETYLGFLQNLNRSQKDILNQLLDLLSPDLANYLFQYLEKCSLEDPTKFSLSHQQMYFKHKCLSWKNCINDTISPQAKRPRMELKTKVENTQNLVNNMSVSNSTHKTIKMSKFNIRKEQKKNVDSIVQETEDDDSSATDVIEKIKGEVKCLIRVCKTEKLTQKNISQLRIVMSQMSSLM